MSRRKSKTISAGQPSEETIRLLEPARGVTDPDDPRVQQVATQLLALSQEEQLAAAQWMGSQPDYIMLVACLLHRIGVSGAVRRVLKRAMFELNRQGVQVTQVYSVAGAERQDARKSEGWVTEEVFASVFYEFSSAVHLRFFMRHPVEGRAVFLLEVTGGGYLGLAQFVDRQVDELHRECLTYTYDALLPGRESEMERNRGMFFTPVPVDWAVQVVNRARQRNLQEHTDIHPHAAFYWGRLPAPPDSPVPNPVDSIPDAETSWALSPLMGNQPEREAPQPLMLMLTEYMPPADMLAEYMSRELERGQSRIVVAGQTEQDRLGRVMEQVAQQIFDDEQLRGWLEDMLPVYGSVALLAGDRRTAVWCKALWRELTERRDKPFWNTRTASLLIAMSFSILMSEIEMAKEGFANDAPLTQ
ncbi:MAG: hypothetical protein WHX60_14425 [Armatimonadota bacterium]